MPGRLIVFEGTDGSGKSTQFARLCARLDGMGRSYQKLVFPQYDQPSSALIRMYLGGEFGTHPSDVNPYAASAFYAVDRYASLKKVWGDYYENGGLVLTDRYTTSNAVHQAVKCTPEDRGDFLRWLDDFEHNKMGLKPAPTPAPTSTNWIPAIWPPAGTAPSRPPGCWAGRLSPVWTARAICAPLRKFTRRSGHWRLLCCEAAPVRRSFYGTHSSRPRF